MATPAAIAVGILLNAASPQADTLIVEETSFGAFEGAERISSDARGRLFVVDRAANTVVVFSPRFELLDEIGGFGWGSSSFDQPTAVSTDGLTLYVSDFGNHRIIRFNQPRTPLSSLSTRDTAYAPARFGFPLGVALTRQGDLYVLDGENVRVVKFDSRSRFETSFGGFESGPGRLREPIELMSSESDRVYVLEKRRVMEFDYAGNFLGVIGHGIIDDARGFCETPTGLAVVSSETIWFFTHNGVLRQTIHRSEIVSGLPSHLTDILIRDDRMFLLSPRSVGVFRIAEPR